MRYTSLRQFFWVLMVILPTHTYAKVIAFGTWGRNGDNETSILLYDKQYSLYFINKINHQTNYNRLPDGQGYRYWQKRTKRK